MRRLAIAILGVALSLAGAATAAQAAGRVGVRTPVAVTPAHGTPTTTFKVRFRAPFTTGLSPGLRSWEIASVADRDQTSTSCTSTADKRLRPAVAHHRVIVTLSAGGNSWCPGAYAGTITLYRAVICNPGPISPGMACPDIAFAPEQIGRFRFAVARAAS